MECVGEIGTTEESVEHDEEISQDSIPPTIKKTGIYVWINYLPPLHT